MRERHGGGGQQRERVEGCTSQSYFVHIFSEAIFKVNTNLLNPFHHQSVSPPEIVEYGGSDTPHNYKTPVHQPKINSHRLACCIPGVYLPQVTS